MSDMCKEFQIYQSEEEVQPGLSSSDLLIIEEELKNVEQSRLDHLLAEIADSATTHRTNSVLYEIFWWGFVPPSNEGYPSIVRYAIALEVITDKINSIDKKKFKIVCNELDKGYTNVIKDLESNIDDIEIEYNNCAEYKVPLWKIIFSNFISLVIALLSMVLQRSRNLFKKKEKPGKILFFPSPSRIEKMSDIIDRAHQTGSPYSVAFLGLRKHKKICKYNNISLDYYITLASVWEFVSVACSEYISLINKNSELELVTSNIVRDYTDIQSEHMVSYCIRSVYKEEFTNLLYYFTVKKTIENTGIQKIVVGTGAGALPRSLWTAANEMHIESYHLPHSVVTPFIKQTPKETIKFVDSEVSLQYAYESDQIKEIYNWIVSGSQHLQNGPVERFSTGNSSTAMIATQPSSARNKKEFMDVCISGLKQNSKINKIIINIHPNESIDEYAEYSGPDIDIVDISPSEIGEETSLLIHRNSNLGLESVLFGVPSVSVIPDGVNLKAMPFSEIGPFPVFNCQSDIQSYLNNITTRDIENLFEKQSKFVKQEYIFDSYLDVLSFHLLREYTECALR